MPQSNHAAEKQFKKHTAEKQLKNTLQRSSRKNKAAEKQSKQKLDHIRGQSLMLGSDEAESRPKPWKGLTHLLS